MKFSTHTGNIARKQFTLNNDTQHNNIKICQNTAVHMQKSSLKIVTALNSQTKYNDDKV